MYPNVCDMFWIVLICFNCLVTYAYYRMLIFTQPFTYLQDITRVCTWIPDDTYLLDISWWFLVLFGSFCAAHQEMMDIVGLLMKAGAWLVKGIAMDAHHSHRYVKEALLGSFGKLKPEDLQTQEFWKDLCYSDVPQHALPRLPLKVTRYQNESLWCLPGACALVVIP